MVCTTGGRGRQVLPPDSFPAPFTDPSSRQAADTSLDEEMVSSVPHHPTPAGITSSRPVPSQQLSTVCHLASCPHCVPLSPPPNGQPKIGSGRALSFGHVQILSFDLGPLQQPRSLESNPAVHMQSPHTLAANGGEVYQLP